jgi:hypothetical protein
MKCPVSLATEVSKPNVQLWNAFSSTHISANSFVDPTAYLTCMGGEPLTGIHCNLNGGLTSLRGPIKIMPKLQVMDQPPILVQQLHLDVHNDMNNLSFMILKDTSMCSKAFYTCSSLTRRTDEAVSCELSWQTSSERSIIDQTQTCAAGSGYEFVVRNVDHYHEVRQSFILEVHQIFCFSSFRSLDGSTIGLNQWVEASTMVEFHNGCPKGSSCLLTPGNLALAVSACFLKPYGHD